MKNTLTHSVLRIHKLPLISLLYGLIAGLVLGLVPAEVVAQCTATIDSNVNASYTYSTPSTVICVTSTTLSRNITIDAANCTINFGGNTYSGILTITANGTNCIINNNSGSNISGTQNVFYAATTVNNSAGATWSGSFYNTNGSGTGWITAPLVINNAGTWGNGSTQLDYRSDLTLTNTGTWNTILYGSYGSTSKTIIINNNAGSTWSGNAQIVLAGNTTITNAGIWNNNQFAVAGTTIINNSGQWNNTQANYTGLLTINHSSTAANSWLATPSQGSGTNNLVVNNSGLWNGVSLDFPAGASQFNNLAGGTGTMPEGKNLGIGASTTITNRGTLTISKLYATLPIGSSLINYAGTVAVTPSNAYTGMTNNGTIDNRATLNVADFTNSGTIINSGTLTLSSRFNNSGSIANSYKVIAVNFDNAGTVSGPAAPQRGSVRVSGVSANSGTFGGNTANRLDFCDTSTNSTSNGGFDTQSGTIGTSTTFCSLVPLPVELTRFTATAAKGQVVLKWATASEKNNRYFAIERSANGQEFAAIAQLNGQGNSTPTEYQATDDKPLPGLSYYRLRQVDFDGATTFSPVAAVTSEVAVLAFTLTPNPVTDVVLVDLGRWAAQPGTAEVLSLNGQVLLSKQLVGGEAHSLDLRTLPAGVYLLRFRTAEQQTVRRLLKL